ncbi:hypothetical protein ACFE04_002355 [Oxalis oulophora]
MDFDPDIVVWKTLLAACKTRGNEDVGKRAGERLLELDPSNSSAHVLLCNLYASSGKWEDVARIRKLLNKSDVKKVPGQSWVEVKNQIHVFFADDTMHPERDKIFIMLEELWLQMLDVIQTLQKPQQDHKPASAVQTAPQNSKMAGLWEVTIETAAQDFKILSHEI